MNTDLNQRLNLSLFLLRLGVFIVMGIWAVDKFVNPTHTAGVLLNFYSIQDVGAGASYAMGAVQLVVLAAFVTGFKRTWAYGIVLLMHGVSTFISYERYLDPWAGANLLFFAAWPMLAAIAALFLLAEYDNWTIDGLTKKEY
ncbi:hypothetical protein [Leucothrix arctica]|uniref:DoxX protein n=1 Tax=Leucothrix arctica TaxID=1481894 RepID=A0A317C9T0_9GAMM|nr:hypothetical protein [Leucothrix arctica]PWQ95298.1 hypothetical protein DKT75_13215 [Leucothrix arctica]